MAEEGEVALRRAELGDVAGVRALATEVGDVPAFWLPQNGLAVEAFVELSPLAITAADANGHGKVLGFACFHDEPSGMASGDPTTWEEWLPRLVEGVDGATRSNTMWLSCLLLHSSVEEVLTREMLRTMFAAFPSVDQFLFLLPASGAATVLPRPLCDLVTCLPSVRGADTADTPPSPYVIYTCPRTSLLPRLLVRPARVEDNDDLMFIFTKQNPEAAKSCSEYFLAELIEAQNEHNRVLVGEVHGRPVGMLTLTTDFDIDQLAATFVLDPFEGIVSESQTSSFCITSFFLDDVFESRAEDFLAPVWDAFPYAMYGLLTAPFTAPEFRLLSRFIPARTRPLESVFPHALYVLPRESFGVCSVRTVQPEDEAAVSTILASQFEGDEPPQGDGDSTVVALTVDGRVCGVACMTPLDCGRQLRSAFDVELYVPLSTTPDANCMMMKWIALLPAYRGRLRDFLHELFRKMRRDCFFVLSSVKWPTDPTLLSDFVLLRPRRQYVDPKSPTDPEEIRGTLHTLTRRMLSEPKDVINTRVVVLGASDTGLAVLETLSTIPYIHFTNLILVAPEGIVDPGRKEPFLPSSHSFYEGEWDHLGVEDRVRVIRATAIHLDRWQKVVTLQMHKGLETEAEVKVAYDMLVIATGVEDQTPDATGMKNVSEGVVSLSNRGDVQAMLAYLERWDQKEAEAAREQETGSSSAIVIYGNTLQSLCALQGFLEQGTDPSRLLLVHPLRETNITPCNNSKIDEMMDEVIATLGIRTIHGNITGAECKDGILTSVSLQREEGADMDSLPCCLLVGCDEPNVNRHVFHTVNENMLVYDGRLVINHTFGTVDPCIYAGGTLTKFSRKYRAPMWLERYNSREVGTKLAWSLMDALDPLSHPRGENEDEDEDPPTIPIFTRPKARGGVLPGGYHYFHAASPSPLQLFSQHKEDPHHGREIVTTAKGTNYTRLHVDIHDRIESITFCGNEPVAAPNLLCLLGLSQTYLNQLVRRYEQGIIDDLIGFFHEPWARALYHDRFVDFAAAVREEVRRCADVSHKLNELMDTEQSVDAKARQEILAQVLPETRHLVVDRLIQYLEAHGVGINVYHVPGRAEP